MSANTKIEWADHTFNPWIGCTKVGPGCDHCYAEADFDKRRHVVQWGAGQERKRTTPSTWAQPIKWNAKAFYECTCCGWRGHANDPEYSAPRNGCIHDLVPARARVFCASLADVFDNAVPQHWRTALFALIYDTPNLDWLLLSKRIGNAAHMLHADAPEQCSLLGANNVWLGATITSQEEADRDIPKLLAVPAAKRFLSMEPLLGPVDIGLLCENWSTDILMDPETGACDCCKRCDYTGIGNDIDWVIVGGESGAHARPMHPDWARSLRDQCEAAGVPFLFKQWGEWKPINQMEEAEHEQLYVPNMKAKPHEDQGNLNDIHGRRCTVDTTVVHIDGTTHSLAEPMAFQQGTEAMMAFKVGKKAAGRLLDGRTWDGVPA